METTKNTYNFPQTKEKQRLFNVRILLSLAHYCLFPIGCCLWAYYYRPHFVILILIGVLIIIPIWRLYCRWWCLQYDSSATLSIDLNTKTFIYERDNRIIFHAEDIESWESYNYGYLMRTFIDVTKLTLKSGVVIYIHDGLGNLNYFLRRNRDLLDIPEEDPHFEITHVNKIKQLLKTERKQYEQTNI